MIRALHLRRLVGLRSSVRALLPLLSSHATVGESSSASCRAFAHQYLHGKHHNMSVEGSTTLIEAKYERRILRAV